MGYAFDSFRDFRVFRGSIGFSSLSLPAWPMRSARDGRFDMASLALRAFDLRLAYFGKQRKSLFGFFGIQQRKGESGMQDDVVAHLHTFQQGERDFLAHPADIYASAVAVDQFDDSYGKGQAHSRILNNRRWVGAGLQARPSSFFMKPSTYAGRTGFRI